MRYVVTGATGYIGKPLCALLLQKGHAVTALTRDVVRAKSALGAEVECILWDKDGPWKAAVSHADIVLHLAGESVSAEAWTPEVKDRLIRSRVDTSRKLIAAMREVERPPQAFIAASGINYYGDAGEKLLTEESPPGSTFLSRLCIEWEAAAREAEPLGVRVVSLRFGVVLERGGALEKMLYPLPVAISPWLLGLGGPIGSGRQWMPWIHRDDAIAMILWAAENRMVSGPVNAVSPTPTRNRDFACALGRALKRPAYLPTPQFAVKLIAGDFADELLTSQRATPAAALRLGFHYRYPDIDSALSAIFPNGRP